MDGPRCRSGRVAGSAGRGHAAFPELVLQNVWDLSCCPLTGATPAGTTIGAGRSNRAPSMDGPRCDVGRLGALPLLRLRRAGHGQSYSQGWCLLNTLAWAKPAGAEPADVGAGCKYRAVMDCQQESCFSQGVGLDNAPAPRTS